MSKLYGEVIADAKKIADLATKNAEQKIIESLAPSIKRAIERRITESMEDEEEVCESESPETDDEMEDCNEEFDVDLRERFDDKLILHRNSLATIVEAGTTIPMKRLEQYRDNLEDTYFQLREASHMLDAQSFLAYEDQLQELFDAVEERIDARTGGFLRSQVDELRSSVKKLAEGNEGKKKVSPLIRQYKALGKKLNEAIAGGKSLNSVLKRSFNSLGREITEMAKKHSMLDENEIMIRLDVPDETELEPEDIEVGVVGAEEDEEGFGDEEFDMPMDDEFSDEEGGGEEFEDVPSDEEEFELEEEGAVFEGDLSELPDDTVIEIDEKELAEALKQMRRGRVFSEDKDFGGTEKHEWKEGKNTKRHQWKPLPGAGKRGLAEGENPRQDAALRRQLRELKRKYNRLANESKTLRERLDEVNSFNIKLLAANRILFREDLTPRQKSVVIERIDSAESSDAVKATYKKLTQSLKRKRSLTEGKKPERKPMGSSSRVTAPSGQGAGSEVLSESRWAKLAGLGEDA